MNDNDKIVQTSMNIIVNAGDARMFVTKSLEDIVSRDFEKAAEDLKVAEQKITDAHNMQTEIIQGAVKGIKEYGEYNILFSHAQDTIMTITSELNIAKQMVNIFKSYEDRISALEKDMDK